MSKFTIGDKVFHVGFGIGVVKTDPEDDVPFPIMVEFGGGYRNYFTRGGLLQEEHTIPQLLTLEEARAKGYDVPKEKRKVKLAPCIMLVQGNYFITNDLYKSEEEAKKIRGHNFVKWLGGTGYEVEVEVDE